MKITVAGCGKVGYVIAEQLVKENHDIIVVDKDEKAVDRVADHLDVLPVIGDAAAAEVLLEAGVEKSELLIAVTDSDTANLLICIVAKKIGIPNTIARIRDPIYATTINLVERDMGLSIVVNPEREAAKEIFSSFLFKGAGQVETFAQVGNEVVTFVAKDNNPIIGMQIKNLSKFINRKVLICAIKRDKEIFIPNGNTAIEANDTISFVANRSDAVYFFKKMHIETGKITDLSIIGGSRLGVYLANMAQTNGIPARIIDKNPEKCEKILSLLPKAEVICGDATDTQMLDECGVFESSAIATCTGFDETNVLVSMYMANKFPDKKIVTEVTKSDFEELIYGIDLGLVFNPKYVAADRVITYVRAMQETEGSEVQSICHVINNKVEVLEFKISKNADYLMTPLMDLKFKTNILLASITRNGVSFIPGGNDTLEIGDTVIVVTTDKCISSFGEIFK